MPQEVFDLRRSLVDYAGQTVVLGIRPEDIEDPAFVSHSTEEALMPIVVDVREAMGSEVYAHFTVDAPPVRTEDTRDLAADTGVEKLEEIAEQGAGGSASFVARLNPRTSAERGRPAKLQVDTRSLHFFDPETGSAIR